MLYFWFFLEQCNKKQTGLQNKKIERLELVELIIERLELVELKIERLELVKLTIERLELIELMIEPLELVELMRDSVLWSTLLQKRYIFWYQQDKPVKQEWENKLNLLRNINWNTECWSILSILY